MQAGCSVTCLQSPLQIFGLQWSTSNTWLMLLSLSLSLSCSDSFLLSHFNVLSLSWAAMSDTLFSLTLSFNSVSCFISFAASVSLSCVPSLYPLSHCHHPSLAVLSLCISIAELACMAMMRFDPLCWMILTWYPTSGRFLSRLTSWS